MTTSNSSSHSSSPHQAFRALPLKALVAASAITLAGCASSGSTLSSRRHETPKPSRTATVTTNQVPFSAPFDPQMGQIVLTVPEVIVSAPVTSKEGNLGGVVRSQLTSTLSTSANFVVADRQTLIEIAQEQKLGAAGATAPADRPLQGQLVAPRYLVKVDVTEFKEEAAGRSRGGRVGFGWISAIVGAVVPEARAVTDVITAINPSIGKGQETVHGVVGMEVRIVDVNTDAVVGATRATGSLTRQNSRLTLGVGGFDTSVAQFSQSVLGQAMRTAVEDATVQIHAILRQRALAQTPAPTAGTALVNTSDLQRSSPLAGLIQIRSAQ